MNEVFTRNTNIPMATGHSLEYFALNAQDFEVGQSISSSKHIVHFKAKQLMRS